MIIRPMQPETLESLHELRWKNRIVISDIPIQTDALPKSGIKERRLMVFSTQPVFTTNYAGKTGRMLEQECADLLNGNKHVILIGLDGGIKEAYDSLDWQLIFADIDKMPMRKSEMRGGYKR